MPLSDHDIDTLVLATVNAPYAKKLDALALAEAITNITVAKNSAGPVSSFFYDVPVTLQHQFAAVHGLTDDALSVAAEDFAEWSGKPWPGAVAA